MLIPAIDLQHGRVVQLEQGEREVLATDDLEGWMARFARYPIVQVVDLDAARGTGDNRRLVDEICRRLPCQVGGGIRTVDKAQSLLDAGARRVIVGSALYDEHGVDVRAAARLSAALGADRLIAAVDSRHDRVLVRGWRQALAVRPEEALRTLEPFAGAFLCTLVETEGLMCGLDLDRVLALRRTTARQLIAAGGIRDVTEVDRLDAAGIDAVVGMAIYTGRLRV
jgi:phosphoribosylformimino-5-aminoimidazole carboxamide ribotide isomerase